MISAPAPSGARSAGGPSMRRLDGGRGIASAPLPGRAEHIGNHAAGDVELHRMRFVGLLGEPLIVSLARLEADGDGGFESHDLADGSMHSHASPLLDDRIAAADEVGLF